jgi:hypothetical protein
LDIPFFSSFYLLRVSGTGVFVLDAPDGSIKSFALAILLVPDNRTAFANSRNPTPLLLVQNVRIMGRFTPVMTSTFWVTKKEKAMFEGDPPKRSVMMRTPSP